ncbi:MULTISPECIES: HAMP domain-containing sensor histidine kinase [unclassified Sphingomonas]|uniref:sensor histidine kinase n=1 Tax=unclassified Sphingomonas TaxID=196159 RepID=UPI00226AE908|nr:MULTISPECIES: HAMP domain-containing sensor histidine kinase [unclassified Sphingomonas]
MRAAPFPFKSVLLHVAFQISSATVLIMYLESGWGREAVKIEKFRLGIEADMLGALASASGHRGLERLDVLRDMSKQPAWHSLVVAKDGRRLAGTLPLDLATAGLMHRGLSEIIVDHRLKTVTLIRPLTGGHTLLLRGSIASTQHRRTMLIGLLGAVLLGLDAAVVAAALQARSMNRRVRSIADVTTEVQLGRLDRRVPRTMNKDAFDRLGAALNTMFAGIERSVNEMRAMTDAIAHDLRSPLMRIRVRVEELCELPLPEHVLGSLDKVLEEMDQVVSMLQVALEITRAEAGVARSQFMLLNLAAVARDMVDSYQVVTDTDGIRLTLAVDGVPVILGHKQLLGQLIANLIDNALSHGGGAVHVSVSDEADGVVLRVGDRGPGIRPEDRSLAMSRFGRLDVARAALGEGLGLSLVQSICHLHSGTVQLLEAAPGLLVEVCLPRGDNSGLP